MKSALVLLLILAAGCLEGTQKEGMPQGMIRIEDVKSPGSRCHEFGNSTKEYPICQAVEMSGYSGSLSPEWLLVEYANESEDISPAVYDINKDGVPEIIAGFSDMIEHTRWTSLIKTIAPNGRVMWEFEMDGQLSANLLAEDINGDGRAEIIAGTENGTLYALDARGRLLWTHKADGKINGILPVNSSKESTEIIFSATDGKVRALDQKGMLLWEYGANATGLAKMGKSGIIIGTNGGIEALSPGGAILWEYTGTSSAVEAADINSDGIEEIIAGTENGTLYALDPEGRLIWEHETGGRIKAKPAIADMDNDGKSEIIAAYGGGIQLLDGNGTRSELRIYGPDGYATGGYRIEEQTYATPAIADLDLDGKPEIITMTAEGNEIILSASREFLANSPAMMSMSGKGNYIINAHTEKNSPYSIAPTVARLDKDPYPDRIYMIPDKIENKSGRQMASAIMILLAQSVKPLTDPAINMHSNGTITNVQEPGYSAEYSERTKEMLITIDAKEEAYLMQYDGIASEIEKERTKICEKEEGPATLYHSGNGTYMTLESGTCALDNTQDARNAHEIIFMKEKIGEGQKTGITIPVKTKPTLIRLLVVKDTLNQKCTDDCEALDREWYALGNVRYVNIDVK